MSSSNAIADVFLYYIMLGCVTLFCIRFLDSIAVLVVFGCIMFGLFLIECILYCFHWFGYKANG